MNNAEILDLFKTLNNIDPYDNDFEFYPRADGRLELICEHGVGHTIYSPNNNFIHGCCGSECCKKFKIIRHPAEINKISLVNL